MQRKKSPPTEFRFPPLHPLQERVARDPARFRILAAGRRFGKSRLAIQTVLDQAMNHAKHVWYMAPTYNNLLPMWLEVKSMIGDLYESKNENSRLLTFRNPKGRGRGGLLAFRSSDSPHNLRGSGLDLVVVDEAAYVDQAVWEGVVYPSLSDKKGRALLISSPAGKSNWFYHAFLRGKGDDPRWKSWHYPTSKNPYIDEEIIADARRDLPDIRYRQEFLAEFTDDAGGVFRGVADVSVAPLCESPREGKTYVAGVDWGRHEDFTVISIFEVETRTQVNLERFTGIGYALQTQRILDAYRRWGFTRIYVEENSMGAPLVENLQAMDVPVEGVYLTQAAKNDLVDRLALNIEKKNITLLDKDTLEGELQIAEMGAYRLKRSRSGLSFSYEAMKGFHDDIVVATFMANKHFHSASAPVLEVSRNLFFPGAAGGGRKENGEVPVHVSAEEARLWETTYHQFRDAGKGPVKSRMLAHKALKERREERASRKYVPQPQ